MITDIAAIDIGTSKICALIAKFDTDSGAISVVGKGTAPSAGLHKGIVTGIDECARALKKAVSLAEADAGAEIGSAYLNLNGISASISENYSEKSIGVESGTITDDDISDLIEMAKNVAICSDEQIVDVIPVKYFLDGIPVKGSIKGQTAGRIGMKAHIVVARVDPVKKLIKCMSASGIEIDGFIVEAMALPELLLTRAEIMSGAVVIDVGGELTDVSYVSGDKPVNNGTLPAGGNHIIKDLAAGLEVRFEDAEQFMRQNIIPLVVDEKTDYELKLKSGAKRQETTVKLSEASDIIGARVEEILTLSREMLAKNNIILKNDASLLVLAGRGLYGIEGASEMAARIFSLPVRTVWEKYEAETAGALAIARFVAHNYADYEYSSKVRYTASKTDAKQERAKGGEGFLRKIKKYFNKSD